jgi:hypothetical protein
VDVIAVECGPDATSIREALGSEEEGGGDLASVNSCGDDDSGTGPAWLGFKVHMEWWPERL